MSQIALLGDYSSGKTAYLTMLTDAFSQSDWRLIPGADEAVELICRWRDVMSAGRFPEPTVWDPGLANLELLQLTFKRDNTEVDLVIPNVAGHAMVPAMGKRFFEQHVDRAEAVIVLIDSTSKEAAWGNYLRFLMNLNLRLSRVVVNREHHPLEWVNRPFLYLAICFTKCDSHAVVDPDRFMQLFATEERLERTVGVSAYNQLSVLRRNSRIKSKLFACSAIGFQSQQTAGNKRTWRTEDGTHCVSQAVRDGNDWRIKDPDTILPVNLEAPLVWILDSIYGPRTTAKKAWFDHFGF